MAGVGLLRLLVKKAGSGTFEDEPPPPPPHRTPPPLPSTAQQGDEERIRKFLEALGQPTTNAPPPPVTPRPSPPPVTEVQREKMKEAVRRARRRSIMTPLPPLTTTPPPFSPRRVVLPRLSPVPDEPAPVAAAPQLSPPPLSAEAYTVAPIASVSGAAQSDLLLLFRSQDDLRRAIILREVLGPPRSLQPLDATGLG